VRLLNNVARIDLTTLQETLGECRRQELYHLFVCLLEYCTSRLQGTRPSQSRGQDSGQEENELLHETIVLLGYYCLRRSENQGVVCYGEGQTLLSKIASLPLHYFMDERGRAVLFPTILATCYGSEQNRELLRNEMNLSLLRDFLRASLERKEEALRPATASSGPRSSQASLVEGGATAGVSGFGGRFPAALWEEALTFFSEEAAEQAETNADAGDRGGTVLDS